MFTDQNIEFLPLGLEVKYNEQQTNNVCVVVNAVLRVLYTTDKGTALKEVNPIYLKLVFPESAEKLSICIVPN